MTYCVAMYLNDGLVFASDTRTNAGVDHVSIFKKLFYFNNANRELVIQSAGNLATTQSVIAILRQEIENDDKDNIMKLKSMFEIAEHLGATLRKVIKRDESELISKNTLSCSFILGGYIGEKNPALYNIYPEGNFVLTNKDTPYFQIGETKYGKPIIDRLINFNTKLSDALKCAMISFDSTIKSNVSVALPIDILVMDRINKTTKQKRLTAQDPYILTVRKSWGQLIVDNFHKIPDLSWEE